MAVPTAQSLLPRTSNTWVERYTASTTSVTARGDASVNLLEKWEKEAQASFDEIRRTEPCRYTIIYREEDSWNDVGIYAGVATKGETVSIQGIAIPGYTLPDDTEKELHPGRRQQTGCFFYVEAIDNNQSMNKHKQEFLIRFTDGTGRTSCRR